MGVESVLPFSRTPGRAAWFKRTIRCRSHLCPPQPSSGPQHPEGKEPGASWPVSKGSRESFEACRPHQCTCSGEGGGGISAEWTLLRHCHVMDQRARLKLEAGLCPTGLESRKAGSARMGPTTTLLHVNSLFLVLEQMCSSRGGSSPFSFLF